MRRFALCFLVLGGCLSNPSVEVDRQAVDMPAGTSSNVTVLIDGAPVEDYGEILWAVDDPSMVTVAPAWDGKHLQIGGNVEGRTTVHINSHGQTLDVKAHVGPPAVVKMWIEPETVATNVGGAVQVKAVAVDTLFHLVDVTRTSKWTVRDLDVATLDMNGMMLRAEAEGLTTLHATNGESSTVVPITILK
ncbi:MAG TPA: hypothetical protein VLB44_04890 [Kofleriaceae bacterium]|nr:hypothetical protein [Kofleriaceae bacterium]